MYEKSVHNFFYANEITFGNHLEMSIKSEITIVMSALLEMGSFFWEKEWEASIACDKLVLDIVLYIPWSTGRYEIRCVCLSIGCLLYYSSYYANILNYEERLRSTCLKEILFCNILSAIIEYAYFLLLGVQSKWSESFTYTPYFASQSIAYNLWYSSSKQNWSWVGNGSTGHFELFISPNSNKSPHNGYSK